MFHVRNRYGKPLLFLLLALLGAASAVVSWGAWTAKRDRERSAILRHYVRKIAASRGITVVEQPLTVLRGHTRSVYAVAFSPDGTRIATAGGDGDATVKIWDSQTAVLLISMSGHDRGVYNLAFSPDGRQLASAGHDETAVIWDVATGKAIRTLRGLEIHV